MHPHYRFFACSLLFTILSAFFGNQPIAHAQSSALRDGWCQQPSDVNYRVSERWVQTIGAGEGGVQAVYQPYNQRIVLQRTEPRELVQVIEEGIALSSFEVLRYTANCRYLITAIRDMAGISSVAVYDLLSGSTTRMGSIPNSGRHNASVDPSPEGNYLLVTATDELFLWNLTTNTQTSLTRLVLSTCEFVSVIGCGGRPMRAYREARWDVPHSLLQLDLISDYTVTLTLPNVTIERVEGTYGAISVDEATTAATAFESDYACIARVQYQAYNRRIVLKDRLSQALLSIVEENLDLSGFQFLGWSATCTYIAAAIEDEQGLRLAVWNVQGGMRQEHPITDWVDRATWSATGDTINVVTDGGSFAWNVSG